MSLTSIPVVRGDDIAVSCRCGDLKHSKHEAFAGQDSMMSSVHLLTLQGQAQLVTVVSS